MPTPTVMFGAVQPEPPKVGRPKRDRVKMRRRKSGH